MIPRILIALSAAWLAGCMTEGSDKSSVDPFPSPLGPKVIPLEGNGFHAEFHYAEFSATGEQVLTSNPLKLDVTSRLAPGIYGYAWEGAQAGWLLQWKDAGSAGSGREKAGIYIVGAFAGDSNFVDSTPVLWIPQAASPDTAWTVGNRTLKLVGDRVPYFSELIMPGDTGVYRRHGFQKHETILIRETNGDTVTHYHFRKGVGCMGFERVVGGRLRASGTIFEIFTRRTY